MKIDNDTIEILKNFSQINNQILVKKGNVIRSMEKGKTILAESKLPFVFEKEFAIYDLSKFILTINLFKNPDLVFNEKHITICDDKKSVDYFYANVETLDDSTIKALNNIKETDTLDKVVISYDTLLNVKNISNTLDFDSLVIEADGKNIIFSMFKTNNQSAGNYKEIVGHTTKTYKILANKIKHKMFKDDYEMVIYDSGITKLIGNKITYWIPGELV